MYASNFLAGAYWRQIRVITHFEETEISFLGCQGKHLSKVFSGCRIFFFILCLVIIVHASAWNWAELSPSGLLMIVPP